jgi:hypothetical protein
VETPASIPNDSRPRFCWDAGVGKPIDAMEEVIAVSAALVFTLLAIVAIFRRRQRAPTDEPPRFRRDLFDPNGGFFHHSGFNHFSGVDFHIEGENDHFAESLGYPPKKPAEPAECDQSASSKKSAIT